MKQLSLTPVRAHHGGSRAQLEAELAQEGDPEIGYYHSYEIVGAVNGPGVRFTLFLSEQQLVGVGERAQQGAWVGVVALSDGDAAVGKPLGLRRVSGDHGDLTCGHPLEEVVGGRAVEGAGGSGDRDPEGRSVVSMETLRRFRR